MSDYQKAKIYKITNDYNDDVYIGHTCDTLIKRFSYHKTHSKQERYMKRPLYKLINNIGFERFRIELICNYPCEDKYMLTQKEGEYIRMLGTLNKDVAGRTRQEYVNDNKDKIKAKRTEYYDNNRNEIIEKAKEYQKHNKERKQELHKIRYINKIGVKCICDCGCSITLGCKKRHEKTKKHLDLMDAKNSQQDTE